MPKHVSIQMAFLFGSIRAERTQIRFLPRVDTQMGLEVVALFEQSATENALVVAFSLLHHHGQVLVAMPCCRALRNGDSKGSALGRFYGRYGNIHACNRPTLLDMRPAKT